LLVVESVRRAGLATTLTLRITTGMRSGAFACLELTCVVPALWLW